MAIGCMKMSGQDYINYKGDYCTNRGVNSLIIFNYEQLSLIVQNLSK